MEPEAALTQATALSSFPDLITLDSLDALSNMAVSITTSGDSPASQEQLQSSIDLMSNLSEVKPPSEADRREVAKKITSSTSQMIAANIDSTLTVETEQIKIRVQ